MRRNKVPGACCKAGLLLIGLSLYGCFGYWDADADPITGNYVAVWTDKVENRAICERSETGAHSLAEVVPAYVFAIGHDSDYIIAKQHPEDANDGGAGIDASVTKYYIIDARSKKGPSTTTVTGPLDSVQFDSLRTALAIRHINFDQQYGHE